MPTPLLATKLHIPPLYPKPVPRRRVIERLNADLPARGGFHRALTLIYVPGSFGKTTLVKVVRSSAD
jgi:LuxR family maltose regulon positive regulatory protein